jgi:hypothetical protein
MTSRLGYALALAEQADISVESATTINDTLPAILYMVSDFSGTAHQGTANPSVSDDAAIGYTFASLSGAYTLVPSAAGTSDIYLMDATSASNAKASINDLPPLPGKWQYAMWVVDTTAASAKAIYYGTFTSPLGYDSDSTNNTFVFPGGKTTSDVRISGNAQVIVALEPGTFGTKPLVPFGAILLKGTISKILSTFSPVTLTNVSATLPTATVQINR